MVIAAIANPVSLLATALTATLKSEEWRRMALFAEVRRSGKGATAAIFFSREPKEEIKTPPPSYEDDPNASKFGVSNLRNLYMDFAHLTIETTINLWGALRGVELEASK